MARSAAPEAQDVQAGSLLVSGLVGVALAAAGFVIGIGATGLAGGTTSFWYLSRASGFVAYFLLWGSVVWGLLLSTGTGRAWIRPPHLLDAHQFLSSVSVGFASFHGLVLIGDRYVRFPLQAVIVPFAARYEPLLVACGQIAVWLSVVLIVSFHVRRWIGGRAWRRLHYASFAAFWLAFVHGIVLGTDTASLWATCVYLATAGPVIFLSLHRVLSMARASSGDRLPGARVQERSVARAGA
jgi:predicted ferric reductase